MRLLVIPFLAAVLATCATSCAHVGDVASAIEDCTDPIVCELGEQAKPTALAVLTCSGLSPQALPVCALEGLGALAGVLGKHGPAAIDCLLERLTRSRSTTLGATGDDALVARRAAAYLATRKARGVTLKGVP